MSEFIKRLQERVQSLKKGSGQDSKLGGMQDISKALAMPMQWLTPNSLSKGLTYLMLLACALSVTYWLMRIAQIPGAPGQANIATSKGAILYSNQDSAAAYGLFGSKPLVTDNISLRGVVITGKAKDGRLDGFAIFEIDGKPTNAISVGENLGKGLTLQSIGDESATLLYEGQKLDFKLSSTKDKPGNSDKSSASKK